MSYDRSSSEYNKLKNWVDAFIKIPFNEYHKLPVTLDDVAIWDYMVPTIMIGEEIWQTPDETL